MGLRSDGTECIFGLDEHEVNHVISETILLVNVSPATIVLIHVRAIGPLLSVESTREIRYKTIHLISKSLKQKYDKRQGT